MASPEPRVYGPVRVLFADIRPGNLGAYYPEANVLVPGRVDSRSRTPAFKSFAVRVERVEPATEDVRAVVAAASR